MKKTTLLLALTLSVLTAGAQNVGKGYDRSCMNPNVKPGDDFVEYATGNYIKTHPLRDDQTENGAFVDLYELNQKRLNELIVGFATTPQPKGSLGQKVGTLYNQMMDSVGREKLGYEPIKPLLEKVRSVDNLKDFIRLCAQIDRKGGSTLPIALGVGADLYQADSNLVSIGQAGLGLRSRDYYVNEDQQTVAVRNAYIAYCKKLFQLVGYDEATAQKKEDAVYAIEKRLAEKFASQVQLRDDAANYHKMSYKELLRDYPGIDWTTIFWVTGFPAFDYVNVKQPDPIHEVEKIYADTPLEDLKSFAELAVIKNAASMLTSEFRKAQMDFNSVMSGTTQDDPMWKRATNLVNGVMGMPLGKLYCEKYFPESSKQHMLELIHNLQKALSQRIDEATWMGAETKAQAKDKLENFIIKVGYPDKWRDFSKMEVSDSIGLVENVSNIMEFLCLDDLNRKVNKRVDKMEWGDVPQVINAYYNPNTNEICFPAGILQPPFFDPEADDAINYGAICGVIGHEMSHGFDDQGCLFDKNGNLHNWWTAEDKKNFDSRATLLEKHFSSIEAIPGKKINGKLTLGENIGDNGGLNIALRAMHNAGITNTIDGFTPDQRFFLGWARVWAGILRPQFIDWIITNDPHSPNAARVNGALPMVDEWYTTFNVKKGDKLYVPKAKRAHIW